ncbi:potassium voltage-gated channel subfamily G member 3 [Corythoichthys intestinalis]|uniref:potassium voltage-gated channel subfamily G member 3 n=1 Tax=Corythoichthys intestinalis TaxID=161448 RepID=UPI0025A681E0|nr:potassium voltage-gated channel subfamily G member 3 [Corythoichthys intestinalis]XP_061807142.1 potassium voltage-gated channel subfamily G member 3-like [Nerophis lumbriciformis]
MKFGKSICVLNVGGTRYAFTRDVIRDFPLRRVSRLHACATEKEVLELCDDYDRERNEFFFDRHAQAFVFIMLYVRSGKLRFVPGVCELSFYTEMLYWGLESAHLDSCCQKRLDDRLSEIGLSEVGLSGDGVEREDTQSPGQGEPVAVIQLTRRAKWLETARRAFEEPNSSIVAQLLATVSVVFVIVSMVMLCASTLPDWDTAKRNTVEEHRIVEAVCIGWFTAECILRFLVARDKWDFLRRPLNIIDVVAITPYYVTMAMARAGMPGAGLGVAGVFLRVLRMMRVFWLMKLARHFLGLQTLGLTLRRCYREMVMLMVFVCVAMAIYSALAQLLEHGLDLGTRNQDYASIPAAAWWVIISMTTVGYGDVYPITIGGRVLGGMCVVSGIVLLALPITFIYHSFVQCYHELRLRSARYARSLSTEMLQ